MSTQTWIERALKDVGETNSTKTKTLVLFRQLLSEKLKNKPPLKARLDDAHVLRFIRFSKYNVERAVNCFINFYKMWDAYPGKIWPIDKAPSDWRLFNEKQQLTYLRTKNKDRSTVFIYRKGLWKPGKDGVVNADLLAPVFWLVDIILEDPAVQMAGYTVIIDGTNFGWSFLPYFDLKMLKVC